MSLLAARILSASGPGFLLLAGALLRLTLVLRAPDLSDDMFRYLWDGRVAAAGISPYARAPRDPALADLAPDLAPKVAHRDIVTVYPPVAQAAFRVFGGAGRPVLWKAFAAAADLSVVALLWSAGGTGAGFAAALYAFHPLPVTEAAGEGHLDSLGVALLLASVAHLSRNRRPFAGVAFALSVLTKYVSLAAAIPLFRRGRWRFAAAAALSAAALWIAATKGGASPAGGMRDYAERWEFNSPVYMGAFALMERTELPRKAKEAFLSLKAEWNHPEWTQGVFPYFYSAFFARALLGLLLAAALLVIGRRMGDLQASVFASFAALLLLSPTLHPWYLLWVLPFAALRRDPAFLYLSFVVPSAYALLYPLPDVSRGIVYAIEFIPLAVLLALTLARRQRLRTEN